MNIFFDLDGTLTDPKEGITNCIRHALQKLDRPLPPALDLLWCIGPPLKASFAILLESEDDALLEKALARYRERFATVGLFENGVYPSITKTLTELAACGHVLYIATSKPTVFTEQIIEHFALTPYFKEVYGSELDGTRSDKTSLISYILETESIHPSDAIMIGDRKHDIIGAKNNELRSCGVLWGYGAKEELVTAGADFCVEKPGDLISVITSQNT